MIYLNSRPVNCKPKPVNVKRRFEWRGLMEEDMESLDRLRDRFDFQKEEIRSDQFFLLPGPRDQIIKIANHETFEIKTLINDDGPLQLWETTVKSKVPVQRTLAQRIARLIP